MCVWKYTSKYGVLGGVCFFFNEATFLLAKNPREAKKLQSKEE